MPHDTTQTWRSINNNVRFVSILEGRTPREMGRGTGVRG